MVTSKAKEFAQALANGDATLDDVIYILEHFDGFLKDKAPDVEKWIPRTFEEVAEDVLKAERIAETEKELDYGF